MSRRRAFPAAAPVMEAEQTDAPKNKMGVPLTDDSAKYVWDSAAASGAPHAATLKAVIDTGKVFRDVVDGAVERVGLCLDSTSAYAEAGGQVADVGTISGPDGASFEVSDVQKFGAYVLHIGKVTSGSFKVGAAVTLALDYGRRALIAQNHTSTHMLNLALRDALGGECDQRGSLCDMDKLRFDFAYGKPLTEAELAATQAGVNRQIDAALTIHTQVVGLDGAKAINGLRAVFGEQYPDPVRVVTVGGDGVQRDRRADEGRVEGVLDRVLRRHAHRQLEGGEQVRAALGGGPRHACAASSA